MSVVPFISNRKRFLKSWAHFPVMKFPRPFFQTFHFLEHCTRFPESQRVSPGYATRWFSLCGGPRYSPDEPPGHAQASFWSRKCSFLEVMNLCITLQLVPLGVAGRRRRKVLFSWSDQPWDEGVAVASMASLLMENPSLGRSLGSEAL